MSQDKLRCTTPMFRASYAHVFTPKAMEEGGEKKYSICMLFPKDADLSKLRAAAKAAAKEKFGDKLKGVKMPFRDGNEKDDEAYEDTIFINCHSKTKPGLIDRDREDILDSTEFFSGCYARATVRAYAWSHPTGGKGVSFGLDNIQMLKTGEPLGTVAPDAADDFDDDLGDDFDDEL